MSAPLRSWWWLIGLLWLMPALAQAKGLQAMVETDDTQVLVGDVVTVDFVVAKPSLRGSVPSPELPQSVAEAFDVGQCSGGRAMRTTQSINGAVTTATVRRVSCPLTARKVGTFKIAFPVPDGKKTVAPTP